MFHVRCRNQISCVAFALSTRNPLGLPVLDIEFTLESSRTDGERISERSTFPISIAFLVVEPTRAVDNSVTSAKLALDAMSLRKVSNGMMIANEANIGIGTPAPRSKLEVTSDWTGERGALELSGHKPTVRFTGGPDLSESSWIIHLGGNGPGDLEFIKKALQTHIGSFGCR
jgi:hypothetical protein